MKAERKIDAFVMGFAGSFRDLGHLGRVGRDRAGRHAASDAADDVGEGGAQVLLRLDEVGLLGAAGDGNLLERAARAVERLLGGIAADVVEGHRVAGKVFALIGVSSSILLTAKPMT